MNKQLNIIKRDGSVVEFDKTKIENAILKAMKYGSGIYEEEMAKEIADEIELSFNQTKDVATVNKVEDMVYKNLINHIPEEKENINFILNYKDLIKDEIGTDIKKVA